MLVCFFIARAPYVAGWSATPYFQLQQSGVFKSSRGSFKVRHLFASISKPASFNKASEITCNGQDDSINRQQNIARIEKDIDLETYQTNLKIAALANDCTNRKNMTVVVQAIRMLRSLKQPDSVAYNSVLKVLAKTSPARIDMVQVYRASASKSKNSPPPTDAANVAEELLNEMISLHGQQVIANRHWYNTLAKGDLSDDEVEKGAPMVRIKPNVRSFSTVMDAWSRLGNLQAAQKCEELLDIMKQEYIKTSDVGLLPTLITYNTLLSAYAKCGAHYKCIEIMNRMGAENIQPDLISHNAVLQAFARSREDDAGFRAELYLRQTMNQIPINGRSYTTCMDAWSQVGRPERAHALLDEMIDCYERTGDEQLAPNVITYSTVINAYAVSTIGDKAFRAHELLRQMIQRNIKPNQVTTNALLNACASSPPNEEVIELLKRVYLTSTRSNQADHFTFGTVLKACSNFFPFDGSFAIQVFEEACKCGQVSNGVLGQFRHAVSPEIYRRLVGGLVEETGETPDAWRRNVRDFPLRRRQR